MNNVPPDDIFFDAHLENLAYDLNVAPPILFGEEAKQAAKTYGSLDNGAYLWKRNENTIALKNKESIATAAHEMRHAWQYKYKHFKFTLPTQHNRLRYILSRLFYLATYNFNQKEIDADQFAAEYCKRNRLTFDYRNVKNRILISKLSRFGVVTALILMLISLGYLTCVKIIFSVHYL